MKAVVFTLGCKVNSYESEILLAGLKQRGYDISEELCFADLYIINTCAVTAEAEKKSRQAVARVKKFNPKAKIIVCGCASQNNEEQFLQKEGVQLVFGTKNKEKILDLLDKSGIYIEKEDLYNPCELIPLTEKTRSFIKIQDGCNNFCSYCLIPYLRGRSRSRNFDELLSEIKNTTSNEIVLTGIDISDYNYQGKTLVDVIKGCQNLDKRIRLGSLEVRVITEEFLQALKNLKYFSEHFHLSMQSGSDVVLKSMNRKYTSLEYLNKVKLIRQYFPYSAITTDVIVGYATETEQEFVNTLNFCKEVNFADIHCFPYSPRKGTVGARLKDLSPEVKKQRMQEILKLKNDFIYSFYLLNATRELVFIPEEFKDGYTLGTTSNYIKCKVKGIFNKEIKIRLCEFGEVCLAEKIGD